MADDTITNFTVATKTVLADIKTKVETVAALKQVHIIAGDKLDQLLKHAPAKTMPPFAVIAYMGSTYQPQPRRKYKFSVLVGTRFVTDDEVAQDDCFDLLDSIIGVIDHEEYDSQLIYKVVAETWQDFTNSGVCIYKIDFVAEDY